MENGYNLYSPGSSGWTSLKNEEFQEQDIWGNFQGNTDSNSKANVCGNFQETMDSNSRARESFILTRFPSANRAVPKPNKSSKSHEPKIVQHSAPVNIPNWSKIYGSRGSSGASRNSCAWLDGDSDGPGIDRGFARSSWESEDEEEDEDTNVIPPHEWIARKLARVKLPSFSVCEGAGRTLKGRDLSRVRNAILTRTGFLEPKE